jgi:hypothetical protein
MDIRSAYAVPDLKKLERTFTYSRAGAGALAVLDEVQFEKAHSFGTALITLGKVTEISSNTLEVAAGDERVRVNIETGGLPFSIHQEQIVEDAPVKPTRVGIDLKDSVTSAGISIRINPLPGKG